MTVDFDWLAETIREIMVDGGGRGTTAALDAAGLPGAELRQLAMETFLRMGEPHPGAAAGEFCTGFMLGWLARERYALKHDAEPAA